MQLRWKCNIYFTCGHWKVFAAWRYWICSKKGQLCADNKEGDKIKEGQSSQNVF